ncbi:MAG: RidA family protein [Bradyrhizobium sp.]|uniref:RidA family protein n=1 Tax=Bradyrhizobium sp. TaxID=376 RepID=UPI001DB46F30|nr:Rid family hydrolase [Bradyrhizobium sp.]MBV9560313.1 RidA family protein [Bradyrhizobium sp.]
MSTLLAAINNDSVPKPFGHYVQAMDAGGLVFVSGQLPARLDGTSLADAPFETQARQSLANLLAIVEGAGLCRDRIAKVTAYLVGIEHWSAFNAIYAEALGEHRPARSVVPVPALHHGYLIELDAIAMR